MNDQTDDSTDDWADAMNEQEASESAEAVQPDELTESLRAYTRHRKSLIQGAARYISKMQKALVVQNIHLSVRPAFRQDERARYQGTSPGKG